MIKFNRYTMMDEAAAGDEGAGSGAATIEGQAVIDGGADGQGGDAAPTFGDEGYQYAGKYDTVQDLEKGYDESVSMHTKKMAEMGEKLKGFTGAPEDGEYTLPDGANAYSEPVMESIGKWAAESGLSQEAYENLLSSVATAEAANMEAYRAEQMTELGKNHEEIIQNINDKWTATFGADATEWMNSKAMSAQDVRMFESILASNAPSQVNPDGSMSAGDVAITQTQLSEAMMKKDSTGMMKIQTDPEYKVMVDNMTAKYNKQRNR